MMLFKLSFQNIRKSFKDYAIYFFTLILGVAIFYVFNSLESQTILLNVSSRTHELIDLMMSVLSGVSVFVAFVLGFLIVYASRFLMKRRQMEFGIYMTLGMGKGSISKILVLETFLIGILSLIIGLFVGIFLSQASSVLVANMFEADMTKFTFVFSSRAMIKTILYFGIMYLFVMIFNTFSVSHCKLIDLLHASKKSESVRLKNPILCVLFFLIGVVSLSYAYYLVTAGVSEMHDFKEIFIPILLGVVSTFLIIWSLSGVILRICMLFRTRYYKKLNSFVVRQISSKINTTVVSMGIITLLLFFTICILSSALSIKNSMTYNLQTLVPADIQIKKAMDLDLRYTTTKTPYNSFLDQKEQVDTKLNIFESFEQAQIDVFHSFQDIHDFYTYENENITLETTLGSALSIVREKYPYLQYFKEEFMRISDYNSLADFYGLPRYEILENEYIIVADYASMVEVRNIALQQHVSISLNGKTYYPKYDQCQKGFVYMSTNHVNGGIFLVPDDFDFHDMARNHVVVANYKGESKEEKAAIEETVANLSSNAYLNRLSYSKIDAVTKISIYEASIGLAAMVTFIGMYLGIIFLISSAAILALKELSESTDNKVRYQMLRKIGTDEKMIFQALFRQIGVFFLFPLIFAIIHSIFGIQFCNYILETFGNENLLLSILMTAIVLIVIYGGYFWITYVCSKQIIKEKTRY